MPILGFIVLCTVLHSRVLFRCRCCLALRDDVGEEPGLDPGSGQIGRWTKIAAIALPYYTIAIARLDPTLQFYSAYLRSACV